MEIFGCFEGPSKNKLNLSPPFKTLHKNKEKVQLKVTIIYNSHNQHSEIQKFYQIPEGERLHASQLLAQLLP
jgi:hypothetical protein